MDVSPSVVCASFSVLCFFQAEDGIRYLVRSRGLGDVYKRQFYNKEAGVKRIVTETGAGQWGSSLAQSGAFFGLEIEIFMVRVSYNQKPVSYTHLTLPTSDLV